ncbi:hypothetical protein BT96DRAFT_825471, partial [Gymnopus androsaceus JB14]
QRGIHDIEKEIKFDGNDKMVAHDSEGFEAGHSKEVDVVKNFIEQRSKEENINLKLHLIWFPVVAIITKFDAFVQDIQQKIEEDAEGEGKEVDDNEIEEEAIKEATDKFEKHYQQPLQRLPYPPSAVVALADEQLEKEKKLRKFHDLSTFFAIAQNADTKTKLITSTINGMFWNYDRQSIPLVRSGPFIDTWETIWTKRSNGSLAVASLREKLTNHWLPRLNIAELQDSDRQYIARLYICRSEQLVADTTLVMEKIYIHNIQDKDELKALVIWYNEQSKTAKYIQQEIMKLYHIRKRNGFKMPSSFTTEAARPLVNIVCNTATGSNAVTGELRSQRIEEVILSLLTLDVHICTSVLRCIPKLLLAVKRMSSHGLQQLYRTAPVWLVAMHCAMRVYTYRVSARLRHT